MLRAKSPYNFHWYRFLNKHFIFKFNDNESNNNIKTGDVHMVSRRERGNTALMLKVAGVPLAAICNTHSTVHGLHSSLIKYRKYQSIPKNTKSCNEEQYKKME